MSLFGTYIQESIEDIDNNLNLEGYQPSLEDVLEIYSDIVNEEYDDENMPLEEGSNLDIRAKFKEAKKAYKEQAKILKKQIKAKEFNAAQNTVTNMEKILSEAEKDIRSVDAGSGGSVILGFFAGCILNFTELLVPTLGGAASAGVIAGGKVAGNAAATTAGIAGRALFGVVNYIKSLVISIKQIKTFSEELNNADTSTPEAFNKYRSTIIRYLNDLKKNLTNIKKGLAKAESKAK